MSNLVTPKHLEEGARWLFTARSTGRETEYVFAAIAQRATAGDGKTPGLDAMCRLVNPVTEKNAWASEKWLREGERPNTCGFWTPLEAAV